VVKKYQIIGLKLAKLENAVSYRVSQLKKNSTFLRFKTANESDLSNRQLRNHYSAKADSVNPGKQKDGHINPQSLLTRQEMETYLKKLYGLLYSFKSHISMTLAFISC